MGKLIMVILSGLCVISYTIEWYSGIQIPAWQALIWCSLAFIRDLDEYLDYHINS